MSELEKTILKTLNYFIIFKFPLTALEVYKNLYRPQKKYSFSQVKKQLKKMAQQKTIGYSRGFYFIKVKYDIVSSRKNKYLLAQKKIKKAKKYLWLISKLPSVKGIFICNNLAYYNPRKKSDIDLAIITAKNKIWTTRLFSTILMMLCVKRPTPKKHNNKICLSFYVTENNLNFQKYAYHEDIHFFYWIKQFFPVYDQKQIIETFYQKNSWLNKYLPNLEFIPPKNRWMLKKSPQQTKTSNKFSNKNFGNLLESFLKKLQLNRLPDNLKKSAEQNNTNVVINDQVLKFHDKDKRQQYRQNWINKTKNLQ